MLVETAVGAAASGAALLGYGMRGRSSRLFGPNVWRGRSDKKEIALTFDDGPSEATLEVLEILETFSARATFFQCGQNIERRPQVARQVHEQGHEIGNHTWSHPRLIFCSPSRINEEIGRTQHAIEAATGVKAGLFRPPYGLRWFGLREALRAHGLTCVMWTVIGYDWEWEAREIASFVISQAWAGGIICLHDGDRAHPVVDRRKTVAALRRIIPELYERGFSFRTAGELAGCST